MSKKATTKITDVSILAKENINIATDSRTNSFPKNIEGINVVSKNVVDISANK